MEFFWISGFLRKNSGGRALSFYLYRIPGVKMEENSIDKCALCPFEAGKMLHCEYFANMHGCAMMFLVKMLAAL